MASNMFPRAAVIAGDAESMADEMIRMVNCKDYSDVKFQVGEDRDIIYAHKCLLAARCEVFQAMFAMPSDSKNADCPIVISDVRPKIFLAVLEFVYTNCCSLSAEIVIDVLAAAVEYGMDGLVQLCVKFMRSSIEVSTVCEFIQAALTYHQFTLQSECLDFIETNTLDVFKSQGFHELSEDALVFILQSDKLQMDEIEVLTYVKQWANVNAVVTDCKLAEVGQQAIQHVRIALLDMQTLTEIEEENRINPFIPVDLIASAWKFHALKNPAHFNTQARPRAGTLSHKN